MTKRGSAGKLRQVTLYAEALTLSFCVFVFRALPLSLSSALGGAIVRSVAPFTRKHDLAKRNLQVMMPELTDDDIRTVLAGMWDNQGRILAELSHLATYMADPTLIDVVDDDGVYERLRDDGKGGLLIIPHLANWEIAGVATLRAGIHQHSFYRPMNNPFSETIVRRLRAPISPAGYIEKKDGAYPIRNVITLLRQGAHIGMMVDRRESQGMEVPFFGHPAMTNPAPAVLAQRTGVPIGIGRLERLPKARFRLTVSEVDVADTGDRQADVYETTRRINAAFEGWIRARPEQWTWNHDRWRPAT